MNVYDEIQDLYNFNEIETFNPTLHKAQYTIESILYTSHSFTTPKGLNVFVYRTEGTMGNHWKLYDINNNKIIISGRKTRKQIINDAKLL